MNKRIKVIASYIDPNDKVADIGCDQAFLSILLAKNMLPSLASDIRENIIKNVEEKIKKLKLDKIISLKVSDGTKNIPEYIDTLVLSGMGSYTILKIINESTKKYKKIITISNNNYDILRSNMLDLGYKVLCEEIIYDKNKFYNLILFIQGKANYTKEDLLIGINHKNKILLNKKLKKDLIKHKKIYNITKKEITKEKINLIEKTLKCHY